MIRIRVLALFVVSMVVLGGIATPSLAASGGTSKAAAACAGDGYLDFTDADGNNFKNAGQCTSYAARGGTLVPVVPSATLVFSWNGYLVTLTGSGLQPGTAVTYTTVHVNGVPWEGTVPDSTVGVDGTLSVANNVLICGWTSFIFSATTLSGGTISTAPSDGPAC